ncbi:hypothetical protein KGF57_003594 [Candida theae]|uniref:Uncharacterized protein n=1 Tax=Candida theae TaxID=1198502 RepID=A0AAD5BD32_9ASCO|nr:uncharacterized protein KGF57_003594 [Candida theae]KAI5955462.1 hypothetical protein KGF57_003594 [Candida theae]
MIISPRLNICELMNGADSDEFDYFSIRKRQQIEQKLPSTDTEESGFTRVAMKRAATATTSEVTLHQHPHTSTLDLPLQGLENDTAMSDQNRNPEGISSLSFDDPSLRYPLNDVDFHLESKCKDSTIDTPMEHGLNQWQDVSVSQEVESDKFRSFSCFATPRMDPHPQLVAEDSSAVDVTTDHITNATHATRAEASSDNIIEGNHGGSSFWRKQFRFTGDKPKMTDASGTRNTRIPGIRAHKKYDLKGYRLIQENVNLNTHKSEGFRGSQVFSSHTQAQTHEDDVISFVVARNRLLAGNTITRGNTDMIQSLENGARSDTTNRVKLRKLNESEFEEDLPLSAIKRATYTTVHNSSLNSTYTKSFDTSTFTESNDVPQTPHTPAPRLSVSSAESLVSDFSHLKVSASDAGASQVKKSILKSCISRIKTLPKVFNKDHHIVYDFGPISLPKLEQTSQAHLNELANPGSIAQTIPNQGFPSEHRDEPRKPLRVRRAFGQDVFKSSTLRHQDDRVRFKNLFIQSETLESSVRLFEKYLDAVIK